MNAVVSRAFQVLSDSDKKSRYDKFGGDPDSRFNPGAGPSAGESPFSGFGGGFPRSSGPGGSMFEEEISPEELFNRFFGGGFGGMGGGGFSPFGMGLELSHISSNIGMRLFTNYVQAAHSSSSTWEEGPVSAFTSSVVPGHVEGLAKLPPTQTSHRPGPSSRLFSLSSSFLSFLSFRRSSPARAASPPVLPTASMLRYPRTPCTVQPRNSTSTTSSFRPTLRTTARENSASWISTWRWSTLRNCGTNAKLRLIHASV